MWRSAARTLRQRHLLLPCFLAAFLPILLAGVLLSSGAQAEAAQPQYWAVIVGISHYEDEGIEDTLGAADARELAARLEPIWGKDHVRLLEDASATKAGIRDAIVTWLAPQEGADDTVLVFFSGHGGSGPDLAPDDEADGQDEYLAPYDSAWYAAAGIRDDELREWLNALDSKKLLVIIDACRSGGFVKELSGDGRVVITSCAENEDSWAQLNIYRHGYFSYHILQALDELATLDANKDLMVSAEEVFRFAQPRVVSVAEKEGFGPQHPQMADSYAGELFLFGIVTITFDDNLDTYQVSQGAAIVVDGKVYSAGELPLSFTWPVGTTHTFSIGTDPVEFPGGERYKFMSWSDGSNVTSRTITPSGPARYEAFYKKQFYLTVSSEHGSIAGTGWYDADSEATFSVSSSTVEDQAGARYVFSGWSGDVVAATPQAGIRMVSPKSVAANWQLQYRLTINSGYGEPQIRWYDANAQATFSVPALREHGDGTRHRFTGWTGDLIADTPTASLGMDSPKTATANWQLQCRLVVQSEFGAPAWQEWHDANSEASFSVPAIVGHGDGSRHAFAGWTGDSTATTPEARVRMDSPKTVIAKWQLQYRLNVTSEYGEAPREQWCNANTKAAFSVPAVVDHKDGSRHIFAGWDDPALPAPEVAIVMDSPRAVAARWQLQYRLSVTSDYGEARWEEWHDAISEASFSVPAIVGHGDGSRHVFAGWTGDATATTPEARVKMDSPKSIAAKWQLQHYLSVEIAPPGIAPVGGEGWYDAGISVATLSVPEVVNGDGGTRYVFLTWKVDDTERQDSPLLVAMDQPHAVAAAYETQHYLSLESRYGSPQGAGWYSSGSQARVSVTSPVGTLIKHFFVRWSEGMRTDGPSSAVLMDKPKTVTADWRTDYMRLDAIVGGILFMIVAILGFLAIGRRRRASLDKGNGGHWSRG